MNSKLQAALCLTHQPVAVYKTHQPPEGSLTMPEESHGCVMILSILVDTFCSRISLSMPPIPKSHNTACVLS